MPESDRDKRQRRAQTALTAIRDSDETRETRLAELARLRAFLERCWTDLQEEDCDEPGREDAA